jgi:hypothetical protein
MTMRLIFASLAAAAVAACQTVPPPDTAKQQIAALTQEWAAGMSRHDIDHVVGLFDPDAVLWGTRSPTIRATPEKVRE